MTFTPESDSGPLRFLVQGTLTRLARHLRLVGFDTEVIEGEFGQAELARSVDYAAETHRILLTSAPMPQTDELPRIRWFQLKDVHPDEQFRQTLKQFKAVEAARGELGFLTRCLDCNTHLHPLPKALAAERLPTEITQKHELFYICTRCERLHWIGDHTARLQLWLQRALHESS